MIIVSQDKTEIVNFERILSIKIFHDEEDKECLYEIYCTVNAPGDCYILIGTYGTEERAKEVLQEIIGLYRKCQQVIGERGGIVNYIYPPKIYQMPKE